MASSGLDEVFRIFDLDLERRERLNSFEWAWQSLQNFELDLAHREWWAWFHQFNLSGLSHYFIWISIISNGVVVIAGWLEVVTSSQIPSCRPFRLPRMRLMNFPVQLSALFTVTGSVYVMLLSLTIGSFNLRSWIEVTTETRSVCAMRSPPGLIPVA